MSARWMVLRSLRRGWRGGALGLALVVTVGVAGGGARSAAPTAETPTVVSMPIPLARTLRSAWVRTFTESGPGQLTLAYPHAAPRAPGSGLTYYPVGGIRTVDGLPLSRQQAFLYGIRRVELNRGQTAMKGADLAGKMGLFAGAMASSFGWMSESEALWLAGGAAALGAVYGAAVGYESTAFREEWRWPRTLDEGGVDLEIQVRPR